MSSTPSSSTPSSSSPSSSPPPRRGRAFALDRSRTEIQRIGTVLRSESIGGALLVVAALVAIVWANTPASDSYFALRDFTIGYAPWHLELSLGAWASDGLLAIFFFLVGLELKREIVAGDLRRFNTAIVPVVAAIGGVVVPALIYLAIVWSQPSLRAGWAIPTATDIAFAVAVLGLIGKHLPAALRIFLLTLAVVDDLIAIIIIAIFYTTELNLWPLVIAIVAVAVYGFIAQRYQSFFHLRASAAWFVLLPIGVVAWAFLHASGIHATIAGVALAFTIPVHPPRTMKEQEAGLAEVFEHRFRPLSAGLAVPVFAFFAAGVAIGGMDGLARAMADPVAIGIIVALVLGKPIGIALTTRVLTAISRAELHPSVRWLDLIGVGALAGIGFTVSLLVAELSFGVGTAHNDDAKIAILAASVLAIALAALLVLPGRRRAARAARAERAAD